MSENAPSTTGGCGCGAVRWELSEPAVSAVYCHCTRCQRRTGTAASISTEIVPGSFRITEGEQFVEAWVPDEGFEKHFCGLCGSALYSMSPDDPDIVAPRMGGYDGDPGVRPSARQFTDYAAPWEPIPDDGLPRHPERRP